MPAPGPEETNVEGVIVRAEDWARARAAVLRRSVGQGGRAPFVAGRVARSLAQLVHRWGADQVETAADKVQQGTHMPPRFVELLGDVLEAPTIAEGPWAGQQQFPDRPRIEARLAGVDQHLAIFRQEMGDDRDPPEDLLRERDDLVRQLDLIDS